MGRQRRLEKIASNYFLGVLAAKGSSATSLDLLNFSSGVMKGDWCWNFQLNRESLLCIIDEATSS
jgi:hypothetical protein